MSLKKKSELVLITFDATIVGMAIAGYVADTETSETYTIKGVSNRTFEGYDKALSKLVKNSNFDGDCLIQECNVQITYYTNTRKRIRIDTYLSKCKVTEKYLVPDYEY